MFGLSTGNERERKRIRKIINEQEHFCGRIVVVTIRNRFEPCCPCNLIVKRITFVREESGDKFQIISTGEKSPSMFTDTRHQRWTLGGLLEVTPNPIGCLPMSLPLAPLSDGLQARSPSSTIYRATTYYYCYSCVHMPTH